MKFGLKAAVCLLCAGMAAADDSGLATGGAAYLNFPQSTRAMAMGDTEVAVIPTDSGGVHGNPATIALLGSHSFTATSGALGLDRSYYFTGYSFPFHYRATDDDMSMSDLRDSGTPRKKPEIVQAASPESHSDVLSYLAESEASPTSHFTSSDFGEAEVSPSDKYLRPVDRSDMALAVGMTYFGIQNIDGRNDFGAPTGNFQNAEREISLAYAARFYQNFSFGLAGKYLSQTVQSAYARGYGFDVGMWYRVPQISASRLDFGFAIRDIGSSLRWTVPDNTFNTNFSYTEPIATKYTMGTAYRTASRRWLWALDVTKARGQNVRAQAGIEWECFSHFLLRAGTNAYSPTAGFGTAWNVGRIEARLDYALQYDLYGLASPQWFTLSLRFPA